MHVVGSHRSPKGCAGVLDCFLFGDALVRRVFPAGFL